MSTKKPRVSPAVRDAIQEALAQSLPTAATPIQNSMLGDAMGFNGAGLGYPGNQGVPGTAAVENVGTIFRNLRYYFISNMRQVLSQAYVEIGLVQTIVDVPVDDGFRGGVAITSKQLGEDQVEQLETAIRHNDDLGRFAQGVKWNRLFGGGGVILMTGQDPETPLDVQALHRETLKLRDVDMWELYYDRQNVSDWSPSLEIDNVDDGDDCYNYYGIRLHRSRVILFKGMEAPSFVRPRLRGFGFSVVEALVRSMNQYLKATDLSFEVLDEFKLDVYKFKNLVNTLMSPNGQQKVRERVQLANWNKNYQNAMVMDSEDDFDHKQLSFSGLAETMTGIRMQVASDMRMPITKLFGTSATGFNSGEADLEVYNSMVESQVRVKSEYDILRVVKLRCMQLFGFIPDDIAITFEPLRVLSAEQEENVKTQKFNRMLQARTAGEITTMEFRDGCNRDKLLSIELDTTMDEVNPDDPNIEKVLGEEPDPMEMAAQLAGGATASNDAETGATGGPKEAKPKDPKDLKVKAQNELDRIIHNSTEFERAAFESDGGDSQYTAPGYEIRMKSPMGLASPDLWAKAKTATLKAYGRDRWQFTRWWYLRAGGKFDAIT